MIYKGAYLVDVSMEGRKGMDIIRKALETNKRQWMGYESTDGRYYLAVVIPTGRQFTVWYERLVVGSLGRARAEILKVVGGGIKYSGVG